MGQSDKADSQSATRDPVATAPIGASKDPNCTRHRRRQAVATCVTCGHAVCEGCVVRTRIGLKCNVCTSGAGRPEGAQKPKRKWRR